MKPENWYALTSTKNLISPSLLVYPERIEKNIQGMIAMSGGTEYLRPHVKTHKMAEIIQMQLAHGISKFKCATIAEAEVLAQCNAEDILLALQPVGANVDRFFALIEKYPYALFSTIVDNPDTIKIISKKAKTLQLKVPLWLDLNVGMNRTGIIPDDKAAMLFEHIAQDPYLVSIGFHAYDGHIREPDPALRKQLCDTAFKPVLGLKKKLEAKGIPVTHIIAGGSPTFPIHAKREGIQASPGTTLLWDKGYGTLFPDIPMLPAAVLFTRVISKPKTGVLCLDLGHKSVASEMPLPRVVIFGLENAKHISQSEEHLVLETDEAEKYAIGQGCYAIPYHICPTVAKYKNVSTVVNGVITGQWKVAARDHQLEI